MNLPNANSGRIYSSYSGSSLGSSASSSYSASTSGTQKTKKGKKKGDSAGSGLGTALLIFGGGFVGGCIYVELMNQATKAKIAAASKAQRSPAPVGNRIDATTQQAKALQSVPRTKQLSATPTQPQQPPDRRLAAQRQQRSIQQPQPTARPQQSASTTIKMPVPTKSSAEVWWSLDGLDMML